MRLLASGRDADVYAAGEDRILRRCRDGRDAGTEAATIRAVVALGYPAPTVYEAAGPDIVMQRVDGPTLAEAMRDGLPADRAGLLLADLHDRLHALRWPSAGPGESLLHLDLHPQNIILSGSRAVVIDWTNARPGPAGLDVAATALVLAQVVVTDGMLAEAGFADERRDDVAALLRAFAARVTTPYLDELPVAEALRRQDRNTSVAECEALPRAVDLARRAASGRRTS